MNAEIAPGDSALRVLVMEEDRDARCCLVMMLEAMGHRAAAVGSAETLSRRMARRTPDAALCDAELSGDDGIEVARRLKRLYPALTVVILAGSWFNFVRATHAALGPVLFKPVGSPELQRALSSAAATEK